ncbi:hypothetical protein ACOMHN_067270 [Nucella lapillus]
MSISLKSLQDTVYPLNTDWMAMSIIMKSSGHSLSPEHRLDGIVQHPKETSGHSLSPEHRLDAGWGAVWKVDDPSNRGPRVRSDRADSVTATPGTDARGRGSLAVKAWRTDPYRNDRLTYSPRPEVNDCHNDNGTTAHPFFQPRQVASHGRVTPSRVLGEERKVSYVMPRLAQPLTDGRQTDPTVRAPSPTDGGDGSEVQEVSSGRLPSPAWLQRVEKGPETVSPPSPALADRGRQSFLAWREFLHSQQRGTADGFHGGLQCQPTERVDCQGRKGDRQTRRARGNRALHRQHGDGQHKGDPCSSQETTALPGYEDTHTPLAMAAETDSGWRREGPPLQMDIVPDTVPESESSDRSYWAPPRDAASLQWWRPRLQTRCPVDASTPVVTDSGAWLPVPGTDYHLVPHSPESSPHLPAMSFTGTARTDTDTCVSSTTPSVLC